MNIALHDFVEISPDVLGQDVNDEMVLLDLKSECYFALDITGARIWNLLREHGQVSEVYRQMLKEFEVDEGELERDLQKHLDQLMAARLIMLRSGPAA